MNQKEEDLEEFPELEKLLKQAHFDEKGDELEGFADLQKLPK